MQDTEGKPIKLNGRPAEFTVKDFTNTNFATAEDKAKWANKFTKFILGGFQRSSFKKEIYKQLHHMFGHCAEYDLDGFYGSNVTLAPNTRAGEGASNRGSTRTVPVKYSACPLPEGCEPFL